MYITNKMIRIVNIEAQGAAPYQGREKTSLLRCDVLGLLPVSRVPLGHGLARGGPTLPHYRARTRAEAGCTGCGDDHCRAPRAEGHTLLGVPQSGGLILTHGGTKGAGTTAETGAGG